MAPTIGERVEQLRLQKGWLQKDLADRSGLHPSHVGLIEKNVRVRLGPETLAKLAGALGVSMAYLLGESDSQGFSPDLEPYRTAIEMAKAAALTPKDLEELINLGSYKEAIAAAKANGLAPAALRRLIDTVSTL